ncbi:MAG: hypothetical protein AAF138_00240 [Planctomycetota bacterium]
MLLLAAAAFTGCRAAPQSQDMLDRPAALGENGRDRAIWVRQGLPPRNEWAGRRVAITNFAVEFVEVKMEGPLKSQPVAGGPVTPFAAALEFSGLGRRQIEYPPEVLDAVPDLLYTEFVRALTGRGFEVLAPEAVRSAPAFQRFTRVDSRKSPICNALNLVSSDTGRVKRTRTLAPAGAPVITGVESGVSLRDVRLELLSQTDADITADVRIRVGVFAGRATLERTSTVRVDAPELAGFITAARSLLSNNAVTASKRFEPVGGDMYTLDSGAFNDAIRSLTDDFFAFALDTQAERR